MDLAFCWTYGNPCFFLRHDLSSSFTCFFLQLLVDVENSIIICQFPFTCSQSPDFGTCQVRPAAGHYELEKNVHIEYIAYLPLFLKGREEQSATCFSWNIRIKNLILKYIVRLQIVSEHYKVDITLPVEMMNCCQAAKRLSGYVAL